MSKNAAAYWLGLAVSAAALPGAAQAEQTQSKSWFKDHPVERQEVLAMCNDTRVGGRAAVTCGNAEDAAEAAAIRDRGPPTTSASTMCALMPAAFKAVNNCPTSGRSAGYR